jgi:hypothetical protein
VTIQTILRWALLPAVVSLLPVGPAQASLVFSTPSGSSAGSDGSVSAEADFTPGKGIIDITLKNLQVVIKTSGQAISGLLFTIDLSPLPKLTSTSLTLDKATFRTFPKKLNPADTDTPNSTVTRWKLFQGTYADGAKNKSSYTLDALTGTKPQQLIIGNGPYPTKPAGSLFEHAPFIALSETFHLTVAGVTDKTKISNVVFQFGTGDGESDHLVKASPPPDTPHGQAVPEPSSLAIAGLGVLGFLAYGLRRRMTS